MPFEETVLTNPRRKVVADPKRLRATERGASLVHKSHHLSAALLNSKPHQPVTPQLRQKIPRASNVLLLSSIKVETPSTMQLL